MTEDLNQAHSTFAADLGQSRQQLLAKLREGIRRGRGELEQTEQGWRSLAYSTLKAICRGCGTFFSRTSRQLHDLPAQLIKPVFETVVQVWDEFFGRAFTDRLTQFSLAVQVRVREFGAAMMDIVRRQSPEASSLPAALAQFQATTEKALAEAFHQAQEQAAKLAGETRSNLVKMIQELIKESMATAFAQAAAKREPDSRDNIMAYLSPAARNCTQGAFDEVQRTAEIATNKLHEQVIGCYQEPIAMILRQAEQEREQLTQAVAAGRQEELLATRNRLESTVKELVALAKEVRIDLT